MATPRSSFFAVAAVFLFLVNAGTCNICVPTCEGTVDLLPDPIDCGRFYQCVHGTPIRMICPSGLFFSPSLLRCDYPEQAKCTSNSALVCGGQNQTTTREVQTTAAPAETSAASASETIASGQTTAAQGVRPLVAFNIPVSGALEVQPSEGTTAENTCVPPCPSPEALYPHPNDCTKYFHCARNVPYLKPCPPGQEYSGPLARCDWPEIAQCTASPDAPCVAATYTPQTTVVPTSPEVQPSERTTAATTCVPPCPSPEALYPHPNDCTKYFHCARNVPYLKPCPPGQEYSGPLARCDWPEIAQCTASPDAPCVAATYTPQTTVVPTSPEVQPSGGTTAATTNQAVSTTRATTLSPAQTSAAQTSGSPLAESTTPPATSTTQAPNTCVPPCPSPEALYPHPNDCTKYFHCARNVPYLKPCPPGQEYSGPLARCDWPEIAQCTASPDAPCVAATYAPQTTVNPSQSTPIPSQTNPPECKPQCPWPYAYMPHPQDCTKFYICDAQMNAFESSCQPGLWYSMDLVRCDYPEVANCIASPETPCDAYIAP